MNDLRTAAQAVLDRWDSPAWEWVKQGPTAALMADLRAALAQEQAEPNAEYERGFIDGVQMQTKSSVDRAVNRMAEQAEPVAWVYIDRITGERVYQRHMAGSVDHSRTIEAPLYAAPARSKSC